jgi:membrane-associated HD superfamily phosphohydrolase
MSKKLNNKILIIILILLGIILVFTELFHKTEKNLKTNIADFDIENVAKIKIKSKTEESITLTKKDSENWRVSKSDKEYKANLNIVNNYLNELSKIKSQRLAAKSKDKWDEYEVTDSSALKIKLFDSKNKSLLDILIGKFSYKQITDQYGRNNAQGISYIRLADEKEIYAVDGFLPMSLDKKLDDWRNKLLCKLNKDDIKSINFTYPDSSFSLNFRDSLWYAGDMQVDAKKVENYLTKLQNKNGGKLNNNFKPVSNPIYQLKIEGDNLTNISINCYKTEDDKLVIQSSLNSEALFESDKDGLVNQIFKSLQNFIN